MERGKSPDYVEISDPAELREILGPVAPRVANKASDRLHDLHRQWLGAARFCLVATSGADGSCDVSPKGDPAGFTHIVDDRTIALPERPGNRRADGYHNVLENPHAGLIYLLPGRGDTLRINGRARLLRDAPFFDDMVVQGHRPKLALLVEIEQIFFHCAKAFMRSELWDAASWTPDALPTRAVIAKSIERSDQTIEEIEAYYGPSYGKRLYD